MKTLVLGLGNPILSDDGVGLLLARSLHGALDGVQVVTAEIGGLNLLDIIQGYDRLFVIDTLVTGAEGIGDLQTLPTGEGGGHFFSSHGVNFYEVMALGKTLGLKIPRLCAVYAIGIGEAATFGSAPSPALGRITDRIRRRILEDIRARLDAATHTCTPAGEAL